MYNGILCQKNIAIKVHDVQMKGSWEGLFPRCESSVLYRAGHFSLGVGTAFYIERAIFPGDGSSVLYREINKVHISKNNSAVL